MSLAIAWGPHRQTLSVGSLLRQEPAPPLHPHPQARPCEEASSSTLPLPVQGQAKWTEVVSVRRPEGPCSSPIPRQLEASFPITASPPWP